MDKEQQEHIDNIYKYAMVLTGFNPKNIVLDEFDLLQKFIARSFPRFPVDEIRTAFELGVKGELGIDLTTYQNFNALYVSNVILAYKRYCSKNNLIIELEAPEPVKELTFDESRHLSEQAEKLFLEGGDLKETNWTSVYKYYKKEGKISFSPEEMNYFMNKVKKDLQKEIKELNAEGKSGISLIYALESQLILGCECRKRAVLNYYEELK